MSIVISLNDKKVLRVKNLIFSVLHDGIVEIGEDEDITFNPSIQMLLNKTDQNVYGAGAVTANIADYLKTRRETLQFADFIKKVIEREYSFFNSYDGCIKQLQEFHQALITYAHQLPQ